MFVTVAVHASSNIIGWVQHHVIIFTTDRVSQDSFVHVRASPPCFDASVIFGFFFPPTFFIPVTIIVANHVTHLSGDKKVTTILQKSVPYLPGTCTWYR